jgi:thiol-disulfide isomerase/thioredoxin
MQRKLSIAALVGLFAMGAPLLARTLVLPEFSGVTHWLNTSKPVDRASLKGKVVLVDFWTYSCINCIRSVPHLKQLYEKYHGQGLEIIGVHTPEFHFEKDVNNVQAAIQKFGIPYPVAMDDNYQMWDAFASRSWPSVYLTDREGVIRYRHFGEGNEAEVEKQIQELLSQNNPAFKPLAPTAVEPVVDFSRIKTPEIYLGALRLAALGNSETVHPQEAQSFKAPATLRKNKVYLDGSWRMEKEYAELDSAEGRVLIRFEANKTNMVLSTSGTPVHADVYADGVPSDVVTIDGSRMYNFTKGTYGAHTLEVRFHGKGVRVYTLTFG